MVDRGQTDDVPEEDFPPSAQVPGANTSPSYFGGTDELGGPVPPPVKPISMEFESLRSRINAIGGAIASVNAYDTGLAALRATAESLARALLGPSDILSQIPGKGDRLRSMMSDQVATSADGDLADAHSIRLEGWTSEATAPGSSSTNPASMRGDGEAEAPNASPRSTVGASGSGQSVPFESPASSRREPRIKIYREGFDFEGLLPEGAPSDEGQRPGGGSAGRLGAVADESPGWTPKEPRPPELIPPSRLGRDPSLVSRELAAGDALRAGFGRLRTRVDEGIGRAFLGDPLHTDRFEPVVPKDAARHEVLIGERTDREIAMPRLLTDAGTSASEPNGILVPPRHWLDPVGEPASEWSGGAMAWNRNPGTGSSSVGDGSRDLSMELGFGLLTTHELLRELIDEVRKGRQSPLPAGNRGIQYTR